MKIEKHLRWGLFCENCRITDFARNLPKVLIAALKVKKNYHDDMKENMHFKKLQLN